MLHLQFSVLLQFRQSAVTSTAVFNDAAVAVISVTAVVAPNLSVVAVVNDAAVAVMISVVAINIVEVAGVNDMAVAVFRLLLVQQPIFL